MISPVMTPVRAKPDAAAVAAVDAARAALLDDVDAADVGEHLGARRRGRARGHPPLRLHPPRVRRLALVGHRGPRVAPEARHRRRGRADPRRRGDRRARVGALPRADPARRPVARRPAARSSDDDPRLVPTYSFGDDPLDADDKAQVRAGRRTTSASAGSAPSRRRAATSPPSAGTTATAAPSSPLAQSAPDSCRTCGFLVRIAGPLAELVRRLRQRRRQRRRPGRLVRPRLRRPLRGAAGPQARAPAAPRAGASTPSPTTSSSASETS